MGKSTISMAIWKKNSLPGRVNLLKKIPSVHITIKIHPDSIQGLRGGPDVHLPQRDFAHLEYGHAAGGL